MNTEGTIEIAGIEYQYKFGTKQTRLFMQSSGLEKMSEYYSSLSLVGDDSLPALLQITKLLRSAITAVNKPKDISKLPKDDDDLLDAINSSGSFTEVITAFTNSVPKIDNSPVPSGK